jgi:hypothetical protein
MSKIQLTIKTSYLPNWGVREGIRELVQNAKDSEVEYNAPLKIDWYNNTLRIENEGTTLARNVLLLGQTSKVGNSSLIGKFGEGLKLGILALLRDGYPVKLRTGGEVWEPKLESSDLFLGEQVLAFHIRNGREFKNRVRIEVSNISKNAWEELQNNFLFLNPPDPASVIKTANGELLLHPKYAGKVFVKGIFVQNHNDISFGYNLFDVTLDRDRKMVESWNLQYNTRYVLLSAVNKQPNLLNKFYDLLENNEKEAKNIDAANVYTLDDSSCRNILKVFENKYGEDAVPVEHLEQSKKLDHLGKRGVVVSKPLYAVLAAKTGGVNAVMQQLNNEVISYHSWSDLQSIEKDNVSKAIAEVQAVTAVGDVDIVTFRNNLLLGQFKEDKVLLSKHILCDYPETLATLIHEVSHRKGGDGDHAHIAEIEKIWKTVYVNTAKIA